MRALIDANVYLSYLIDTKSHGPPAVVVRSGISQRFPLLITAGVIREFRDKSQSKPYLAARITLDEADALAATLATVAENVPEISPPLPEVGPDRKDDYLFAHALLGRADYLVSGDGGVQKVGRIGDVRIVSPADFVALLRESGRLS